jgi:hypothetical protein
MKDEDFLVAAKEPSQGKKANLWAGGLTRSFRHDTSMRLDVKASTICEYLHPYSPESCELLFYSLSIGWLEMGDANPVRNRGHFLDFFQEESGSEVPGGKGQIRHLIRKGNLDDETLHPTPFHSAPNSIRWAGVTRINDGIAVGIF